MRKAALIIPCFNEADRLQTKTFVDYVQKNSSATFIFVDDGSADATLSIIKAMSDAAPGHIFCLELGQNSGKAEAVRQGVLAALDGKLAGEFDYIGFWDADLATPLAAVDDFCSFLYEHPGAFAVFGSRVKLLGRTIKRKASRHYLGRIFATLASLLLRLPVYDTQCGAKLFRRSEVLRRMFSVPFSVGWVFDVEILARYLLISNGADSIIEYPLQEWRDIPGSKVKVADFFRTVPELIKLWLLLRAPVFSKRYRALFPDP